MRFVLIACFTVFSGCATSQSASSAAPASPVESLPSSLQVEEMKVGQGDEATAGKQVTVQYEGFLTDGRRFASSARDGRPLSFTLGKGQVIRGLDEGILGMKAGGKRRLVIPPRLAYGLPSALPADATVVYEVELLSVQ